jgi:cytochrome c peroxidase
MNNKYSIAVVLPFLIASTLFLLTGCGRQDIDGTISTRKVVWSAPSGTGESLLSLPRPDNSDPERKVNLGRRLFFDPSLSHDNTVACANCHNLQAGGDDDRAVSLGINGQFGPVNTPTVLNATLNFVQFWDGRANSLEEQAAGPVHNPVEMASNWPEVIQKLAQDADYQREFSALYPGGISGDSIVDAIASFERTLLTPNSRFDRHLGGDSKALNALEKSGLKRFLEYGCASCHQGAAIGGNMFQRFGVMNDYFAGREHKPADLGRFNVTGREEDRHVFKVPSLRNIGVTAPYFHDGSVRSLEEAVIIMGRFQLGREIPAADVKAITAFLHTLTGELDGKILDGTALK